MSRPNGRAAWVAKGRRLGLLESRPKAPDTDDLIHRLLSAADRDCGEYPKNQQKAVWGWFTEGRYGR